MASLFSISAPASAVSSWLVLVPSPAPERDPGPWYETLVLQRSRAEDTAFNSLRWLLTMLPCQSLLVQAQDIFDDATLAVPASDALAVAVAERAVSCFLLTGAFPKSRAESLYAGPRAQLLERVPAPANVLTPAQEANTRFGLVTKGGYAWCWEQTLDNPAVAAGAAPAQGMLRANSEAEAIERLREHFPAAGPFQWISRRSFTLPSGLHTAY